MKKILRDFTIYTLSLWLVSQAGEGIVFAKGAITLVMAGVGLSLAHFLLRPLINLLLLPINLVTLGLFRWVSNVITLWTVTKIVTDFSIPYYKFFGIKISLYAIPGFETSGLVALVVVSLLISLISGFVFWLRK